MSRANPHDAYFKATFADLRVAADALRRSLPAAVARRIDWARLERVPAEFVGEDLTDRRADLVFRAPLAGQDAFIFVLYEHQSSSDPLMPFRALVYIVRIWESWLREHPGARRLPAVIPVVLHHGERPWAGPVSLHEMLDLPPELLEPLARHLPGVELVLDDLSRATDEEIEGSTAFALATVALLTLKNGAYVPDPLNARLMGHLAAAMQHEVGRKSVERALRYLYTVGEFDPDRVRTRLAESAPDPRLRELIMTAADRLIEKGIEQGIEKGIAQGEARGRAALLLRQLALKFGDLPDDVRSRVERADVPTLDRWADQILTAPDLDRALA